MKNLYSFAFFILLINTANTQSVVETFCGTGIAGLTNGTPNQTAFNYPQSICIDQMGNLYITDSDNNCIRKIDQNGNSTTFAGGSGPQDTGYVDGEKSIARFNVPSGICINAQGDLFVTDFWNHCVRKISASTGMVSTVAGSTIEGYADGISDSAQFNSPRALVLSPDENFLFVADSWNHRIRKIDLQNNTVSTYAGSGVFGYPNQGSHNDGQDTVSATFYTPTGLDIDSNGVLYVADAFNHRIRKIDTLGVVTTVVGNGPSGSANGSYAPGNTATARLNVPVELMLLPSGDILVSDLYSQRIRLITNDTVETYAGTGSVGFYDDYAELSQLNNPRAMTLSLTGDTLFFTDQGNNVIRMIFTQENQNPPTSNNQLSFQDQFKVYPSPVSDQLVIDLSNLQTNDLNIVIQNALGQTIYSNNVNTSIEAIDASSWNTGMYAAKLVSNHKVMAVQKIIKR